MTESEQLLSVFSEDYFFKELVLDDLKSTKICGSILFYGPVCQSAHNKRSSNFIPSLCLCAH